MHTMYLAPTPMAGGSGGGEPPPEWKELLFEKPAILQAIKKMEDKWLKDTAEKIAPIVPHIALPPITIVHPLPAISIKVPDYDKFILPISVGGAPPPPDDAAAAPPPLGGSPPPPKKAELPKEPAPSETSLLSAIKNFLLDLIQRIWQIVLQVFSFISSLGTQLKNCF